MIRRRHCRLVIRRDIVLDDRVAVDVRRRYLPRLRRCRRTGRGGNRNPIDRLVGRSVLGGRRDTPSAGEYYDDNNKDIKHPKWFHGGISGAYTFK